MERAEAEAVYAAGREACVEFLVELSTRHERQIARLEARIERLEGRLRENSSNSSQPPSADPPAPGTARRRSPSARKPGGQPGHEGTTRQLVAEGELDAVIDHLPSRCSSCGDDLARGEPSLRTRRKAEKFAAMGGKIRATQPSARGDERLREESNMASLEAKNFESPDEVRPFTDKGEAKIVKLSSGDRRLGDIRAGDGAGRSTSSRSRAPTAVRPRTWATWSRAG